MNAPCPASPSPLSQATGWASLAQAVGQFAAAPALAVSALLTWQERVRERATLREMDERALHDIGLSRADIEREAEKPFWRL
jgi:uncharacterized protein YjiS (DUF1127 family)